jgi:hypothetical protein
LEPIRFFDDFPRFLDTSETGHSLDRLNVRYTGLIQSNQKLLEGASVLDLASHDGRWSFAAIKAGASHVVGVEHKPRLVSKSQENFLEYGIEDGVWRFVEGDLYQKLPGLKEKFDVVFCFGILYHVRHHMLLFEQIERLLPTTIIVDTNVSQHEDPVTYWMKEPRGPKLVGHPSKSALEAMLGHYGYNSQFFDWHASGLPLPLDYKSGKRVTVVATRQP